MDSHTALCQELLRKLEVPGFRQTFVLGSFARRVTIRSQQVRALNLIYALTKTNRVGPSDKVLIIGAGFAGLTAAAAAKQVGCHVTLLEKAQTTLSLQRNCRHRYLHPNIYDWPTQGSLDENARLPLLNWKAGTAESVVNTIDSEFEALIPQLPGALLRTFGVKSVTVLPSGDVIWGETGANRREPFGTIILAVGFGLESSAAPDSSYWADTPIDFNNADSESIRVLVSGNGDGALTDLMRLCIRDFRHDKVLGRFAAAGSVEAIVNQVREIENSLDSRDPAYLSSEYLSDRLRFPADLPRRNLHVDWVPGAKDAFSNESCALNRFIVAQLFHSGAFNLLFAGRTENVKPLAGGGFEVTFSNGKTGQFNRVVRRHGPKPVIDQEFPSVAEACKSLRHDWSSIASDWTSRVLLQEELPSHLGMARNGSPVDPLIADDLNAVSLHGYNLSSIVNRETIFIVVGNGIWQELLDRPAANLLCSAINEKGDQKFRRAIVISESAWHITESIRSNSVIAVGGPQANPLAEAMKDKSPYEVGAGVYGAWELHQGLPRAALWGTDAQRTFQSVQNYLTRSDGLQTFLRQCWK
jgi:hypothetical protein